ncbi:hypothetical protein WJ0W_005788 [Paenibacillus melissococcoides]|uniref:Uncharacterized protein n=1 Tax=Paenibacillus melissococcoides TaxID=2912268 RepID=A0ABM9G9F0_9BACL|nr:MULTISPECIES: hypothetical protein [Paenibacillus]MEB9896777.1 hypothetical protein [Bacillus cereus]CAH8248604.1 hypothetical protein WJ0W_005788 [Paenibacillus melissococcoides]CAH8714273.1 hypothetical protein WDD9_003824 [Paenibacillus melissococcoides]CAH8719960.1 hypothetical protein HTL2_005783 [Paenibacillus melissococcoides]GIO79565.1 hypothetical protein J6TS7_31750 [Paenibacillus dendritiformis]
MKVKAKTYWVWTKLAEETFDHRYTKGGQKRVAGEPTFGNPEEVDLAWLNRGYVIDAEDYVPADGQMDISELGITV